MKVLTKSQKCKCIVHYGNKSDTKVRPLTKISWNTVKKAESVRQSLEDDTEQRLDSICTSIPKTFTREYGYHRSCYQRFTNVSKLKVKTYKRKAPEPDDDHYESKRTRLCTVPLSPTQCLFCDKKRLTKHHQEEKLVACITKNSELAIIAAAEEKQDHVHIKLSGCDIRAKGVTYHESCRRTYIRSTVRHSVRNSRSSGILDAHSTAFEHLCLYVEESIIAGAKVHRMSYLKEMYLAFMLENTPEHYNEHYKTEKLKEKLINYFKDRIRVVRSSSGSDLVYSINMLGHGSDFESSFREADGNQLEECAIYIRRLILKAKEDCPQMPWPPSADYLEDNIRIPEELTRFLTRLITSGNVASITRKHERSVRSVGEDLCYVVSHGKWLMPKHLLLGMTIRHLTGSAQVITILNRLGHSVSYSTLLELETAMCNATVDDNSIVPPTICKTRNTVTHLCWDNFDLNEETPSGAGTTHTAHGIIIQECECPAAASEEQTTSHTPEVQRTKQRSISLSLSAPAPCFLAGKAEPNITISQTYAHHESSTKQATMSDMMWILSRLQAQAQGGTQTIPGWCGWLSMTASKSENNSTSRSVVDYMPPINTPITENSTVQELLNVCVQDFYRSGIHQNMYLVLLWKYYLPYSRLEN